MALKTAARDITRILAGLAAFGLGGALILLTRPPGHPWALYREYLGWGVWGLAGDPLAWLWHSLPSFFYVFSFSLLTAGIAGAKLRAGFFICLLWGLLAIALELGQRYKVIALRVIPSWFEDLPWLANVENYFIMGAFDSLDLAMAALGVCCAWGIMILTVEVP